MYKLINALRVAAVIGLSAALPASATIVYRLAGAVCTDSNHAEAPPPTPLDPFGVGPKLCSDPLIELQMSNAYVPGALFTQLGSDSPPNQFVERFSYSDGFGSIVSTFPPLVGAQVTGTVSTSAPAILTANWEEFWFFRTFADGTWQFGIEGGGGIGVCGVGSTPGIPGVCTPPGFFSPGNPHYSAIGTYSSWQMVPEPGSAFLAAIALAGVFVTRRSRADTRRRA